MGERGPRKMRILVPEIKANGRFLEWRPSNVYKNMKIFNFKVKFIRIKMLC